MLKNRRETYMSKALRISSHGINATAVSLEE